MNDPAVARAVEIFAAINLIAVGLSHVFRPQAWGAFFSLLHSKGAPGNFMNAFLSLGMGSIIVAFHNIWSGVPVILTLYGWASVAKGSLYLLFPELGLRSIERGTKLDSRSWVIAGTMLILVGASVLFFGTDPGPELRIAVPN